MIMTTDSFTDRLSEYLDGELSAPERAAVDAHLLECGACRSTLDDLRAVVAEAAQLTNAPPARELWSGIAARIAPGGRPRARVSPFRRAITSRLSFTLPQLAAAGIALMVLSGGLVWLARSGDPRADFQPISAQTELGPPVVAPANFADAHYDEAIADLERTLEAGRAKLEPETVRVLEENLRSIDRAIDQCRRALAMDPANVYLNTHLADTRQRKLTLLRRATALATLGSTGG
jgi:tetratricopeptide (TPR) repeat protein